MSFSLNYELFMYFWFWSFFHSYGSFNHITSTSLSFSESAVLFLSISLLSQLKKVILHFHLPGVTSDIIMSFSMNPLCSRLPCASLMFIWYLFIMLPQGSLGFIIRTSSDWSRGFSSCYHSKMGKHIAKSSSLTPLMYMMSI